MFPSYIMSESGRESIKVISLKVKTSIGNAPISKNEMEALITNHVKEYVLTNT